MRLPFVGVLIFFVSVSSILVEITPDSKTRCYTTELSPDKTLQAKFGILRNDIEQCQIRFTINIKDEDNKIRETIHDNQYYCRQTRTNDPYVVKHTSEHLQYHGSYELCVEPINVRSRLLLIEVYIGEKMNPLSFYQEESSLPLVEAAQLIEVEERVRTIKKILVGLEGQAAKSKEQGEIFDISVKDIVKTNKIITIFHVVLLIVFGIIWIYLVKQLKRKQ